MVDKRPSEDSGSSLPVNDFRTSIAKIGCDGASTEDEDEFSRASNEKLWRLSFLKKKFETLQLQKLFNRYSQRISHGYFSQFLSLQIILSTIHFITVLVSNISDPLLVLPDLILYALIILLSIACLIVTDIFIKKHPQLLSIFTITAFVILFFTNIFIPFYYRVNDEGKIRPAYTTHIIISVYVFLNIRNNLLAFCLGLFVSIMHMTTIIIVTYGDSDMLWQRILSDALYLSCINGLGIYFRYMNEIVKRRSFLDRRSCVESTLQVKFEEHQESKLMSSIIPKQLIEEVKRDIITFWEAIENKKEQTTYLPFDKAYLEEHDNVSILFADIVNYTQMTTQLDIKDLLNTLNELFTRFDDASSDLKVLRIKFLGDCYYCVAGLPPDPAPNHAEAVVDLGLKMIAIIADVRKRTNNLGIDMRIGIHSGKITSGLIGSVKWQYDIWSNDVDLANKMETEGQPGRVHITESTKKLLTKPYDIAPYKIVNNINTYLIAPTPKKEVKPSETDHIYMNYDLDVSQRRPTIYKKRNTNGLDSRGSASSIAINNNNTNNNSNIKFSPDIQMNVESEINHKFNTYYEENETSQRRPTIYKKKNIVTQDTRNSNNSMNTLIDNDIIENISEVEESFGTYARRSTMTYGPTRVSNIGRENGKRRTAFFYNMKTYEEMLKQTSKELEDTIENMLLSKFEQWFKVDEMNRAFLIFKNFKSEISFIKLTDPLFKYYLLGALILLIVVYIIENLTLSEWDWMSIPFYIAIALMVIIFFPLTWTHYLWTKKYENRTPTKAVLKFLFETSRYVTQSVIARIVIYTTVCIIFGVCVLVELIDCEVHSDDGVTLEQRNLLHLVLRQEDKTTYCIIPWHMTDTCSLAIIMSFVFLRMYMWIKFLYASTIAIVYSYCVWNFSDGFYENHETLNYAVKPQVAHIVAVVFVTIILHLIDRQTEYMNRLDHSWYETLIERKKRATSINALNKLLLQNILPAHVAEQYLQMTRQAYEPERYDGVAIMFASLVNYSTEGMGKNFLNVMNTLICAFDALTVDLPIEKIKIAKWTYMAASGLVPGRGNAENIRRDSKEHPIISLIKFASSLMKQLQQLNRESLQEIELRIGISYGPIAAGVVGSRKPLYDVWGDPVNMASRMDTSGLPNHIQVLKHTAEIIQDFGYACNYRGKIIIKGPKEPVDTYFVALDNKFDLIKKEI